MIKYFDKIYGNKKKAQVNMSPRLRYKQFFTPQKYSQVMIDMLKIEAPKKIIDLAIGGGSLLTEAMRRWEEASYYGNDIDAQCCKNICDNYKSIKKCFNKDIFEETTINDIINKIGTVDLCLGNPPFQLIKQHESIKNILKTFNLNKYYKSEYIPAEVIFVLQCLQILSPNGTLALILPDGFFVNGYLKYFREFLIMNYKLEQIVELPSSIFQDTDAKTHILVLKKSKPSSSNIILMKDSDIISITKEQAINRMDYNFYLASNRYSQYKCISDLDIEFIRGKVKYLIKDIANNYILHTTSFSHESTFSNHLRTPNKLLKYENKLAIPGDIIIARVGSYCIGKIGIIKQGYFVATDCVFIVRVSDITLRNKIFQLLKSDAGQKWIKANSKGVSAKHITLADFKKFPLFG